MEHYEMCDKGMSKPGEGSTVYLLSRCDSNNPYPLSMPDSDPVPSKDGSLSGSDFEPPCLSVSCEF